MKILRITAMILLAFLFPSKAEMFPVTDGDKAFFGQLKRAVLADDMEWFSEALSYPIVVSLDSGDIKLESKEATKKRASAIFTPYLKSVVQNQTADSLFKNWRGIMVGNGQIWFSQVGETRGKETVWAYRITSVIAREQPKPGLNGEKRKTSR